MAYEQKIAKAIIRITILANLKNKIQSIIKKKLFRIVETDYLGDTCLKLAIGLITSVTRKNCQMPLKVAQK